MTSKILLHGTQNTMTQNTLYFGNTFFSIGEGIALRNGIFAQIFANKPIGYSILLFWQDVIRGCE